MHRILVLMLFFISFILVSAGANAQNPADPDEPHRPDVSNWILNASSNISVNVSDSVNYYLGYDLTFQNPNNLNEYVRQIRLFIPFVVVKSKASLDKNFSDAAVAYVTDGSEKALLKDYLTKSDVILYIRWTVKPDVNRGTEMLVGENEVWFWDAIGKWTYGKGIKINTLMPSERFKQVGNYPVIVGVKYFLNRKIYNSTEVPHEFILIAVRATRGGK